MSTVLPHDPFHQRDLEDLAGVDGDVCVSLYLPTHPSAPESHQDPVRLKNLLDEAEARLLDQGHRRPDVEELLQPAREILKDDFFWTHQSEGLAIFLRKGSFRRYRLPVPFEQTVEVAGQFLVTPLVWFLKPGHMFYVLAVSQNSCRLFRGSQFQIQELEPDELPKDLQSALGRWRERRLSFHSQPRSQSDAAIYHGHEEDDKAIDLAAYLRQVAAPVRSLLHNKAVPLVFAGVKEMYPIFRDVYDGEGLVKEPISGNPDNLSAKQLHHSAWTIVNQHHQQRVSKTWDEFHAAKNQQQGTQDLDLILPACRDGLVKTLILAEGARQAGTFDVDTREHQPTRESTSAVDLLNCAAVNALRTDAEVLAVSPATFPESPESGAAAAILRGPLSAIPKPTSSF